MSMRRYLRFSLSYRVQHFLLMLSFSVLAITGLPQKYPDTGWAVVIFRVLGGIEQTRIFHHTAAVVLVLVSIYHVVEVGYRLFVLRVSPSMALSGRDITDFIQMVKYNLGLSQKQPRFDRYNFIEKLEYWAVVWGTVVMAITGFMLWNPIVVTRYLPGEFIPAAKAAHGMEALLAVLSIVTWHFYFVHLAHFNKSIFTGYLDEEEMQEEHAGELERLRREGMPGMPPPHQRWARERIYVPVATVLAVFLLIGVWRFLTIEETAITTLPHRATEVKAYQPIGLQELAKVSLATPTPPPRVLTAPTPTPMPVVSHSVEGEMAQCNLCHDVDGLIAPAPLDHKDWPESGCLTCHPVQGE